MICFRCCGLIVDTHVKHIHQQNAELTAFGSRRHVHKSIWRQGSRALGQGLGNYIKIVNVKRANPLRPAVCDREVVGGQAGDFPFESETTTSTTTRRTLWWMTKSLGSVCCAFEPCRVLRRR